MILTVNRWPLDAKNCKHLQGDIVPIQPRTRQSHDDSPRYRRASVRGLGWGGAGNVDCRGGVGREERDVDGVAQCT